MSLFSTNSQDISQEATHEFPLSAGQQGLWAIYQLSPDSGTYNLFVAARLRASLHISTFQRAAQKLVERHPALRTTVTLARGKPIQRVAAQAQVFFQHEDASAWSEAEMEQRLAIEADSPFYLEDGPLLRVYLFTRAEAEHILLLVTHHIVSDYWSLTTIVREVGVLYEMELGKATDPLSPLESDYADYIRWHADLMAGPQGAQMSAYWREQLAGRPPALNLPTDHPRPPIQTYRGGTQSCVLETELVRQLTELGQAQGTSLYATLLATFQVLLHRYTGQDDIWVGSPLAGRSQTAYSGLVGYFSNHVVLRARLSDDPTFNQFLAQTHQTVQDAITHQDYPFATLVQQIHQERDFSRSPLFQASFVFMQANLLGETDSGMLMMGVGGKKLQWSGLQLETLALGEQSAQTDLSLIAGEVDGTLVVQLRYSADLFEAETISRMLAHWRALLQSILADPDQPISQLSLLSEAKRQEILFAWNDTRRDYPRGQCIHAWFEAQAARTPEAVAVIGKANSSATQLTEMSYEALNQHANQLARHLQALNVKRGDLVGICMDRNVDVIASMLGILKAGGAYLSLDPKYPQERVKLLLEDAHVSVLLTQESLRQGLEEYGVHLVCLDTNWPMIAQQDDENLACVTSSDDLAYVMYTSGSTGKPKGGMITHANLCSHINAMREVMRMTEKDRHLHAQSFSFSASVRGIFTPLCTGACVVLATSEQIQAPLVLFETIKEWDITTWAVTPSYWRNCIQVLGSATPEKQNHLLNNKLRLIISGGEVLASDIPENWAYSLSHGAQVVNMLGQTEVTGIVCTHPVTVARNEAPHGVPSGRPISNARIYLLDRYLKPVPVGLPGEMYVGGEGVGRGYFHRPELTAERFIPDLFSSEPGLRLYKTGDLARYRADGIIEFLGRADYQINIRGLRIEPGEVEAILIQHPGIRAAVVTGVVIGQGTSTGQYQGGNQQLAAYLIADTDSLPTPGELRVFMKKQLPDYMIPSAFIFLDSFPLTPTGKVNRNVLPQVDASHLGLDDADYAPPRNSVEEALVRIWANLLSVELEQVGIYDNFFELGGHSLLAVQSMAYLQEMLSIDEPLIALFFEDPTIAGVSDALLQSEAGQSDIETIAETLNLIATMSDEDVDKMLAEMDDDPAG